MLFMLLASLLSVKLINDYMVLLLACWSCQLPVISIFPQTSLSPSGISSSSPNSQSFPSSILMSPWILCFFLLSLHCGQSCRQFFIVWFPHAAFLHVGCWLFLDTNCLWVSLVCPICIILSLTLYCLFWHFRILWCVV